MLRDLADKAALKPDDLEVAAFIVREPNGDLACRLWPPSAGRRSEHYDGPLPVGTMAIAHSHPYYAPLPSTIDVAQAKRIGLPIYVVSRWELHVVDPISGERVRLLRGRNWSGIAERHACSPMTTLR